MSVHPLSNAPSVFDAFDLVMRDLIDATTMAMDGAGRRAPTSPEPTAPGGREALPIALLGASRRLA